MTGGFSRAIELIESETGWLDDDVLAMPICRVRQKIELITQKNTEALRTKARMLEWQTKQIAVALSALSQDKSQTKAFEKIIKKMKLPLGDEESIDTRTQEEIIEQGALVDLDNQPSFEDLSALFGEQ